MHLHITTPERTLFTGEADMVTIPGALGDFGVLPGHAPVVSTLRPGVIAIERSGTTPLRLAVTEGIAEITPERCLILAETARPLEGMTAADAQAELRAAEEDLSNAPDEAQQREAEKKLAMARTVAEAL